MSYISVDHLCKTFTVRKKREKGSLMREKETIHALKDVSFDLVPESGKVSVGGMTPWTDRKAHVRRIGVVFGQRSQLWWDVPLLDSYSLLRDIYRVSEADYQKRLNELTEALQLGDLLRTPLRLLSLGQRMRAELCGSLLHSPELLFLDEPTIGLDAVSKLALRDFLLWENQEKGTTILLTTHDMEDIAALCPRVMVIGHGEKLYDGGLQEMLSKYDTKRTVQVEEHRNIDHVIAAMYNLPQPGYDACCHCRRYALSLAFSFSVSGYRSF